MYEQPMIQIFRSFYSSPEEFYKEYDDDDTFPYVLGQLEFVAKFMTFPDEYTPEQKERETINRIVKGWV